MHDEKWLSLVDYAVLKNLSISTLRRYIKRDRVKYKLEGGKYYISTLNDQDRLKELERRNEQLREENDELRMLIALYEAKGSLEIGLRDNTRY